MEITREIALRVRETVAAGLVNGMGPVRSVFAWLFVALVMAVFVELGFRAFDHEWDVQMRRNAALREMR